MVRNLFRFRFFRKYFVVGCYFYGIGRRKFGVNYFRCGVDCYFGVYYYYVVGA